MGKSWRIATVSGIPIILHWTLGLFVLFFIWFAYNGSFELERAVFLMGFIISLFVCILLHEFGHSLTAKRYGVITKDIILSPIGGLARLESIPENPIEELRITINGPLVNLIIAGIIASIIGVFGLGFSPGFTNGRIEIEANNFLQWLMYMNLGVFAFNLIPAFPMDGGRILRSLLSIKVGRVRATFWASLIGKIFAILFVLYTVFNGDFILAIIGAFIFFMAGQEYDQVKLGEVVKGTSLEAIVRKDFIKLHLDDSVNSLLEKLDSIEERDFLVYDQEEEICGSLPSLYVEELASNSDKYNYIKDFYSKSYDGMDCDQSIDEAFKLMKEKGLAVIAIKKDGQTIGVVDRPAISTFILDHSRTKFLSLKS